MNEKNICAFNLKTQADEQLKDNLQSKQDE
jgi:hypothetical protein